MTSSTLTSSEPSRSGRRDFRAREPASILIANGKKKDDRCCFTPFFTETNARNMATSIGRPCPGSAGR
jgi:hypothetical protein